MDDDREKKLFRRTAAASAIVDEEAATEGLETPEDREKAIRALEVMHQRGLIPDEVFQARLKALETSCPDE